MRALRPFLFAIVAMLLWLASGNATRAQSTGRIECARSDEYVYLYSSITTLQVRGTVQCGEVVAITLRYDYYYGVRTAKGDEGFVAQSSVQIIKDRPSAAPAPPAPGAAREKIHYDKAPPDAVPPRVIPPFTLLKNTAVRLKLVNTLSSATAQIGDPVTLEVVDDVLVDGVVVLRKGDKAAGTVAEVELKKKFGKGGRLAISMTSLRLADGEKAPLRSYEEVSGAASGSHISSGKDAVMMEGTQFVVLVDEDVHLNREALEALKNSPAASSSNSNPADATPPRPR